MKSTLIGKLLAFVAVCSLSQFAFADTESAIKSVAGILTNLNHFASDADKATLMAISEDEGNGRGIRAVATAVHNIQHAATADDKEIMGTVLASDRAQAGVKSLAGIVAEFNHMVSDEAKATLGSL